MTYRILAVATLAVMLGLVVWSRAGGGPPAEQPPPASEKPTSTDASTDPLAGIPMPGESMPAPPGEPMILVKNSAYNAKDPLLFDSGYEEDNSACMVCHIDFEHEKMASIHEKSGITCMACHGDSMRHRGDEFNITRPDVIWGRAEIDPFCIQCHPKHKKPEAVEEFRKEWLGKRRENGRYVMQDSTCMDCHGKHAIVSEEGQFK